ncbi:MAG: hypothetical protein ACUVXA_05805 [Candidatus Jordarchaeum sp.]|uniref:hypothetical protein n=1 Tax=Candidatus Jordarchaeum sp. TaxID=2823881 RepID=UPI004049DBA9
MSQKEKEKAQNPSSGSNPGSPDLKAKTASAAAAIPKGASREEEISMLRMMVNILEDSVNTMLRIEKTLNERLVSVERRLAETEKRLSDRIGSIGISGSEKLEETLGKAVNDMQKGMEIMVLQNMVEKVEELAAQVRGQPLPEKKKPAEEKKEEKYVPRSQRREKEWEREEREFRDRSKDKAEFRETPREEGEDRLVRPSDLFGRGY